MINTANFRLKNRSLLSIILLFLLTVVHSQNVANYPFSGNANDPNDSRNNGFLGDGNGLFEPTLITTGLGDQNNAYQFDGADDRIELPAGILNNQGEFTIGVYLRFNQFSAQAARFRSILSKTGQFELLAKNSEIQFNTYDDTGSELISLTYDHLSNGNSIDDGVWHHVAVVQTTTNVTIYIDGVEEATTTYSGTYQISTSNPVVLGEPQDGNYVYFPGDIDELYFYSRDLSLSEIGDLSIVRSIPIQRCIEDGILYWGDVYPTGGVYSGVGVTDSNDGINFEFDPTTAGVGYHDIIYTLDSRTATHEITIDGTTWAADADADGFPSETEFTIACNQPEGYLWPSNPFDCDDSDNTVNPDSKWFADVDGDGYGDINAAAIEQCEMPTGPASAYVLNNTDCDDTNNLINPDATDVAGSGIDANCDGNYLWYLDADEDGYGGTETVSSTNSTPGNGESDVNTDCDDGDPSNSPGLSEILDGIDNNCDGEVDEGLTDNDNDGFAAEIDDCDDTNNQINPAATDAAGSGIDANCDGDYLWYIDADGDGFGETATFSSTNSTPGSGESAVNTDCNDQNSEEFPGQSWYVDADGDGFGNINGNAEVNCSQPSGFVSNNTDCDDNDANEFPGQIWFADNDQDGYGDNNTNIVQCEIPTGPANNYVLENTDCDDANNQINPAANDVAGSGIDANCDGNYLWYIDADGDGFGETATVSSTNSTPGNGESAVNTDCNDQNSEEFPGQTWYADNDNDGYGNAENMTTACVQPAGYVANDLDCDDTGEQSFPQSWYPDGDNDGLGDATYGQWTSYGSGLNGLVYAIAESGDYIYVGGDFSYAGGVSASRIARWNKVTETWSALGSGVNSIVRSLIVDGDDLYVGGNFSLAGGTSANKVAKWNLTSELWSSLGSGITGTQVEALTIHSGVLYVGGNFTTAGGSSSPNLASWDITLEEWNTFSGTNSTIYALEVLNDQLYVGGAFTSIGGVSASRIASYDIVANEWHPLGTGVNSTVRVITSYGSSVYVGGDFGQAGGSSALRIARWDAANQSWSALGSGLNNHVYALTIEENELVVGGAFSSAGGISGAHYVVRWDTYQEQWSSLAAGLNSAVFALSKGNGQLSIGGQFNMANGETNNRFVSYGGLLSCDAPAGYVDNADDCDDSDNGVGVGATWYADRDGDGYGDEFVSVISCNQPVNYVSNSDDCDDSDDLKTPVTVWYLDDDGDGYGDAENTVTQCEQPDRYVLDNTDCDDSNELINPATNWYEDVDEDGFGDMNSTLVQCDQPVGFVLDNTDCDDNNDAITPELVWYVDLDGDGQGDISDLGITSCEQPDGYVTNNTDCNDNNSDEFNGQTWYADTDGDGYGDSGNTQTQCEQPDGYVLDDSDCVDSDSDQFPGQVWYPDADADGFGDKAYREWTSYGSGLNGSVMAIAESGNDIYVGGSFTTAGGGSASRIARWDKTTNTWSALGTGLNGTVRAILVEGSDIYVGGDFSQAGGSSAQRIAKWNIVSETWSPLGLGTNSTVYALALHDSKLYVGGSFTTAGGASSPYFAEWNTDTENWTAVTGTNSFIRDLRVANDKLYAGGSFTSIGGVSANRVAVYSFTNSTWSPFGDGVNSGVLTLATLGTDVFVGGLFTTAGGMSANSAAKWDSNLETWSPMSLNGDGENVFDLAVVDQKLYAAAEFSIASGNPPFVTYDELFEVVEWNVETQEWSSLESSPISRVYSLGGGNKLLQIGGHSILSSYGGKVSCTQPAGFVTDNSDCDDQYALNQLVCANTWDGTTWSAGSPPTAADDAVIAGIYTFPEDGAFTVNNLIINSQETLLIDGEATLDVMGDLTNLGSITIAGGSLKVNGDLVLSGDISVASEASLLPMGSVSGGGNATINRNTTFGTADGKYSVIGSPITSGSTSSLGSIVYKYDESIAFDGVGNNRFVRVTTPEIMSIGDAYFSANTGDISFTGTPNSGNIDIALAYTDGIPSRVEIALPNDYALVSNPYTAAISYDLLMAGNTDIDGTLYFWDDGGSNVEQRNNSDYITATSMGAAGGGSTRSGDWDGYIRSTQGFFVAFNASGTFHLTPTMMVTSNNDDGGYFRKAEADIIRLALFSDDFYSDMLIGFTEEATVDFDRTLDAYKLKGNGDLQLYSRMGEDIMAIQALPNSLEKITVDLGFDAAKAGTYTLEISDFPESDLHLYLIDHLLNKKVNLTEVNSYSFSTATVEGSHRFSLLFAPDEVLSIAQEEMSNELLVYSKDQEVFLKTKKDVEGATVSIYTLNGTLVQQVSNVSFHRSKWSTSLNGEGVFIVTLQSENEFLVAKFHK